MDFHPFSQLLLVSQAPDWMPPHFLSETRHPLFTEDERITESRVSGFSGKALWWNLGKSSVKQTRWRRNPAINESNMICFVENIKQIGKILKRLRQEFSCIHPPTSTTTSSLPACLRFCSCSVCPYVCPVEFCLHSTWVLPMPISERQTQTLISKYLLVEFFVEIFFLS